MSDEQHHTLSVPASLAIYVALLVLLGLTVLFAYLDLGAIAVPVAFLIATIKALLIIFYFMHVKFSSRLIQLFSLGGGLWLMILLAYTLADYLGRDMIDVVGK